jgi:catechol-2,3-dioxygenase
MPITRLNHAVLYVRNAERSRDFYEQVLGFRTLAFVAGQMAFLQAPASTNDHDLGLFQVGDAAGASTAGRSTVGLYHLAWEVDTLTELKRIRDLLVERAALVGASDHVTTKALYAQDPDGIEFEVSWLLPVQHVTPELVASSKGPPLPLDLDAEIARFGAETRGGVGISVPAAI